MKYDFLISLLKTGTLHDQMARNRTVYFTAALSLISSSGVSFSQEPTQIANFGSSNPESSPIAFSPSYVGLILDQNHPWSFGSSTWSQGGTSWGAEYRFFYKDKWTLSISGEFKQLKDLSSQDSSIFAISQETMRLFRVYHPWYIAGGGRLSYYVPVRKISIPYERDQSRAIDTGAAIGFSTIWIMNPKLLIMLSANRWRSLSTTKKQGIELIGSALFTIR